jgi:hypothetical protein
MAPVNIMGLGAAMNQKHFDVATGCKRGELFSTDEKPF